MTEPIHIAAAIVRDAAGRILLVRKRNTTAFMQPGGKIEAGERAEDALRREIAEELGSGIRAARFVQRAQAPAANEPGRIVQADLFEVDLDGAVAIGAEIAESVWADPKSPVDARGIPLPLAPLTERYVIARG